jgi:hypothetical protein
LKKAGEPAVEAFAPEDIKITADNNVHAAAMEARMRAYQSRVQAVLDSALPGADLIPQRLHAAQRYAVLGGGKRLRPLLVYCTGEALHSRSRPGRPAAAVELIHSYSLVHDDLPAMDDDDLRRGQPTTHRAFDEATAILAGDALQVLAFSLLARDRAPGVSSEARIKMIQILADASGTEGMAGGQAIDLSAVGRKLDLDELEAMHRLKTGALIRASVLMAAACSPSHQRLRVECARWLFPGHRTRISDPGRHPRCRRQFRGSRQDHRRRCGPGQTDLSEYLGWRRPRSALAITDPRLRTAHAPGASGQVLAWLAAYVIERKV